MGEFADGLRAAAGEAARRLTEAQAAGDHYGAEAYRERLRYLRRVARRHGVELSPVRDPQPASGPTGVHRGKQCRRQ